jgi:glycosyltransferase involved in cell wall biosynthesis
MEDSVSIVIPVYNGEKYLEECVMSCINQTYKNFNITIVDDGSTDDTFKIAWDITQKYPHITLIQKNNGGTGSALNTGIDATHGKWIKWLSADDCFFAEDSLERMMDYISHVDPGKRFDYLYYCDYEIIDENGSFKGIFQEPNRNAMPQEMLAAELYYNFFGNGSTSIFHRSTWYAVGPFNENMPYNDDYEYWLRWVLKNKLPMHHIPFISTQYRIHSESLTGTKKPDENLKLVEDLRRNYKQYLNEYQLKYLSEKKQKLTRRLAKKLPGPILNGLMRLKK